MEVQEPLCPSSLGMALAVALQGTGRCCTVHDDIGALLQHLGTIGGSARVLPQVLLADVVEGQDTGELRVCLQGPALGLDHCWPCLGEMAERRA